MADLDPQPIPTTWRGWKFRSRTEARWAVFLDALGITFYYEPEGFVLSSGDRYLPDFFLPKVRYYAEVKPYELTGEHVDKPNQLARDSNRPVILLNGPPGFSTYATIFPYTGTDREAIMLEVLLDVDYHGRRHYRDGDLFVPVDPNEFKGERSFTPSYIDAVHRSRAERFGVHE